MSLYFDCAINSRGGAGNIHIRNDGQQYNPLLIKNPEKKLKTFSNVVVVIVSKIP